MGCGSSSLKGEKVNDVNGENQPAKRVRTNFSEVDFSSSAGPDRRGTMAVAPDEQRRPTKISEVSADGVPDAPKTPTKSKASVEKAGQSPTGGTKLEPYRTLEEPEDGLGESSEAKKMMTDAAPEIQSNTVPTGAEATALAGTGAAPLKVN